MEGIGHAGLGDTGLGTPLAIVKSLAALMSLAPSSTWLLANVLAWLLAYSEQFHSFLLQNPILFPVVKHYSSGNSFLSFLLDPTTKPLVISLTQTQGTQITEKLCYMTRTWLYYMHKERLKQLGFWKY